VTSPLPRSTTPVAPTVNTPESGAPSLIAPAPALPGTGTGSAGGDGWRRWVIVALAAGGVLAIGGSLVPRRRN
jgi:hypothetical protein